MATDLTNVAVSTGYVQLLHIDGGVGGSVTRVYDGDGTGTPLQISTSEVQILDGSYDFDVASHDGTNGLKLGGTLVTSSAAELNYNDISTLGTAQASKVLTADSSLDVTGIRNLTATGTIQAANFTGTGNTTIGDAVTDTVAVNATITTNLIFEGSTANDYETTLAITDPTADRTWTIPDSTDTFVGKVTTDTLTNKTLTAPVLNTVDINGGTVDAITTLTVANSVDVGNYTITANGFTADGTIQYGSLSDGSITITAFVDEDGMDSNSATLVPTQQSVKAYVDAQVTAQDLDLTTDSGTIAIDLDSETLTLTGGTGVDTSASSNTVTFALDLNELSTETTIADADFIAMVDATDSGSGKITFENLEDAIFSSVSGDVLITEAGVASIQANSVALTTDTVGDYVQNITAGTGLTSTGDTSGENIAHSLSVDVAQSHVTSLGTLTALQVDNLNINGNTISSTAGTDLLITPLAGQQIVLDGTIVVDAGVVTGATSITSTAFVGDMTGDVTGNADTATKIASITNSNIVQLTSSQTLTNKTLISPVLDTGVSGTAIKDEDTFASDSNTHLATQQSIKAYVDSVAQGLNVKTSCAVATTANVTLSGEQTIDGVTTSASRILVKDQSTASQNGIYQTAAGAWSRTTDFDDPAEVASSFVFISGGTAGADTGWVCTNEPESVAVGTDGITFSQFSDAGHITAGTGLTKSGNSININAAQSTITSVGALGTPSSGVLTNATGLPIATGVSGLATGVATFLATPTSANLISAVTNETGTGSLVFATSPTLVTPALGTPASGVATNITGLPIVAGTTGTLSVARGGTGATSLIDGGVLLGSGTGAVTATAVLGDGEILIGDGTTDPVALDIGSSTAVTIVGALNSGSITSGFGTIDTGSSTITTTGVITAGGLTIGSAVITEAELEILDGASLSTTELNYVDGVTSAIQTQIDTKAPLASPTFTGTITIGSAGISETELEILDGLTVTTAELNVLDASLKENNSIWIGSDPSGTTDTASNNTALGVTALDAITTGDNNTAIGYGAMTANTTGGSNIAVGTNSLVTNTTGATNTAVGNNALYANTTASNNVAVGYGSGENITTGADNTAVGTESLKQNTTASNNTAVGKSALTANTTGTNNVAVGANALDAVTTANNNIAIGLDSLSGAAGNQNVAIGTDSQKLSTAADNTSVGYLALAANTTGDRNVAVGALALDANIGADANTAVGYSALSANTSAESNTAIGFNSMLLNTTGGNNTAIGGTALGANTTGGENVAIGVQALDANTTASYNTAVGSGSLSANTTGAQNTAVGQNALLTNTTASYNTAVGRSSLEANTTGYNNAAVGYSTLKANTTGFGNIAMGRGALISNTIGADNIAIGYDALGDNVDGNRSVSVGTSTLSLQDPASNLHMNNTAIGYAAGNSVTNGDRNTLIGSVAGDKIDTGSANTCVGFEAGSYGNDITSGSSHTLIGAYCTPTSATANDAHCLGYNLDAETAYTTLGNGASDIRAPHGNVTWATVSDERVKKDITDSTAGLNFVNALRPRTFKYKTLGELPESFRAYEADSTEVFKNTQTNHGFIAQEVKAAIDADSSIKDGFRLWDDREDGSQEVAESALIPVLVKAVQELTAKVEALENA